MKLEATKLENKITNPIGKISIRPRKRTKSWLQYSRKRKKI